MIRFAVSLAFAALLWAPGASAFCRATTCDPSDATQRCAIDGATQCVTSGTPLRWTGSCITINVQRDGAPNAGISAEAAQASVQRAVDTWLSADCGDGTPSLTVEVAAPVTCNVSEYSGDHHNANIVMFREQSWPYEGSEDALGITRLRFDDDQAPGMLWDADIELNAVAEPLAVGTPLSSEVDLDSLITHEMGHLLGLGHTLSPDATMIAGYVKGSTALRSLTSDDVAGICATYPPSRQASDDNCQPRHGFSELCAADQPPFVEPNVNPGSEPGPEDKGCAVSTEASRSATGGWLVALLAFAFVARKRAR